MENEPLDPRLLRTFSPLDGLKKENLLALSKKTTLKELPAGRLLFREGDTDKRTYYLARGEVELSSGDQRVAVIKAGTVEARSPVAPGVPRRFTAKTLTSIEYLAIDSDLLDVLITWDQT